ncbi:MAG: hypothetical protein OEZ25_00215 [Candidatus Bathyarchaeota archaeon]|nr:hypothetical protein [Candidatus Bathyarchaeota archaeon]
MKGITTLYPKKSNLIFGDRNFRNYGRIYRKYRGRVAFKLQNPRVKRISFNTFRHWKATMEYAKTKDLLSTLLYTQLVHFESDDYHSAVAETIDEAKIDRWSARITWLQN